MPTEWFVFGVFCALLSSAFTLFGAYICYRFLLARKMAEALETMTKSHVTELEKGLEAAAADIMPEFRGELVSGFEEAAERMMPEFRGELVSGFEEAAERMMPEFRAEVTQGFTDGATAILPEFRREVTEGVREALVGVASIDFVDQTAQNVAKKSSKLFESGLNAIFGKTRRDKNKNGPPK